MGSRRGSVPWRAASPGTVNDRDERGYVYGTRDRQRHKRAGQLVRLPLSHGEIRDLLAAHALDAVDAAEAGAVEAHLLECDRCRADMRGYRKVVALLPPRSHGHSG